ncbi:pH-response regulator protein palA [Hirsutella minnesotensis 3608]|uniref:pH-response regulator protein palA n=1 Tax=Hirsutella minnesotensis 3608 TaxID=1043627 RepID=A0A0F8A3H7_9HYPO|nr:pH-response regulator protein palA [Hirsutella minnesotensis 3608]
MSNNTTSSILSLPFRRSTHMTLSTTIRQYINTKYDQHPDMFKQDLEVVDALRRDAVDVREPHPSGIKKLQAYAGQLIWMGGKFPIDIGAEFTWYPALGYNTERPLVRNNLKYELMNILYNLAALYSQLAANSSRSTPEGLKFAAHHFNLAAGVMEHIQNEVLPELRMSDPPDDMDAHTLEALAQLLLAQSQECSWQSGVMNNLKDLSIAKLAARVSDLYNLAAEAAVRSEAISSAWIHHMTAKHHHFAAAAQFRAARDCLEKRKYGEEVARLRDAVACVTDGLKETRGGYLSKTIQEDLSALKRIAEDDLKRSEKDNDMIFLNPVPPKSELKILDRFNMAAAKVPPQVASPFDYLGDKAEFGPALFSRLVPFSVHMAISIYEERRDRIVNHNIIQELEALTEKAHALLSSLGLPGSLQALEKPLGLPPSLVQHAEELRQGDAIGRVHKSFDDIDKLRAADLAIFEAGKAALEAEKDEDERFRRKYGTDRWARPDSLSDPQGAKLWSHASEIEGYFQSSVSSDSIVRDKFAASEDLLRVLCGPDRELMNFVPSSTQRETGPELKSSVGKLRSAYNDVLRLESRRRKKVERLRESARKDDIKPDILREAARLERNYPSTAIVPAHFEDFFEKRLDRLYEPELEGMDKEAEEQEALLASVERANREFDSQRRKVSDRGLREREQALQKLDSAYFKYKEVVSNLEVGRKFYNDLSKIVGQGFRDVVKEWVAQRQMDARALEEELSMPPLSTLNLGHDHNRGQNSNPPTTSAAYERHAQDETSHFASEPVSAHRHSQSTAEARIQSWAGGMPQPQPLAAPLPNPTGSGGVWNPGMGIKFGSGPQGAADRQGQGQGGQQGGGRGTTWDPSAGIRFG